VFSTGGERTGLRDADSVVHFIAGLAGFVVFFAVFVLLSIYSDFTSIFANGVIAAACWTLTSATVFQVVQRNQVKRRAKAAEEYRDMLEADTQRKIGEMQRANSNIPTVERKQ
jgi:protein tyrosine phosphatase